MNQAGGSGRLTDIGRIARTRNAQMRKNVRIVRLSHLFIDERRKVFNRLPYR
jgi:hypothetical protein